MDAIFRALSDPHRRQLLDLLRAQDGQTLSELEARFDEMTRFGVMKHLKVLEAASLVSTRKVGRFKYHYLNPLPIQEVADRWIARFARPWTHSLLNLKYELERNDVMTTPTTTQPKHVFVTIIQTTPEKLWEALTTPQMTAQYYFGARLACELQVGQPYYYFSPEGQVMVSGEILEIVPQQKLVTTFTGTCGHDEDEEEKPSQVTYEIEPQGDCCKLTLIHDGFDSETTTYQQVGNGWPTILSGLKTLLETGKPLGYNPLAS